MAPPEYKAARAVSEHHSQGTELGMRVAGCLLLLALSSMAEEQLMTQDKALPKRTIGRQKIKSMLKEILERALNNGEEKSLEQKIEQQEKNLQLKKKLREKKKVLGNILLKLLAGQKNFEERSLQAKPPLSKVEEIGKQSGIFPPQKHKSMLQEILERRKKNGEDKPGMKKDKEKNLQSEKRKRLLKFLGKYAKESKLTKQDVEEINAKTKVEEIAKRSVFDIIPHRQTTKMSYSKVATIIEAFRKTNNAMTKSIIKRLVQKFFLSKNKH